MTKINIGGFELDSTKLPKEGLDYSKFDEQIRNSLSVFDIDNKKGHLSRAELQKAIDFFASQDGAKEVKNDADGKTVKYHKKNGEIDKFEYNKTESKYNDKALANSQQNKSLVKAEAVAAKKMINEFIEDYKKNHNGRLPSDDTLKIAEDAIYGLYALKLLDEFTLPNMDIAIDSIYSVIEANKKGLKIAPDSSGKIFVSEDNKYYTYHNGEFYPSDKKGNYSIKEKLNDKGQQAAQVFDKQGEFIGLKALNYQGKTYKKDFAAQALGLNPCKDGYYKMTSNKEKVNDLLGNIKSFEIYQWNEKTHTFDFKNYTNAVEI